MEFLPLLQCSTLLHRSNGFAPNEFLAFPEINLARNRRNASAKSATDEACWNHEYVAALAERGRRRAPRFGRFHQAEPTRSATASTAASGPLPLLRADSRAFLSKGPLHQSTSLQDWITDARARSAALREFDGLCDRATTIAASVRAPNRRCARTSTSCRPINPALIAADRACFISPNPYLASISRHLGQPRTAGASTSNILCTLGSEQTSRNTPMPRSSACSGSESAAVSVTSLACTSCMTESTMASNTPSLPS